MTRGINLYRGTVKSLVYGAPAMTVHEQAVEAATKVLAPHISGFELDLLSPHQQKDIADTVRLVLTAALDDFDKLQAALDAILADPHGCAFCDSGKLRNPAKPHDPKCGYALLAPLVIADQRPGETK